jgi:hypothetical protein
LDHLRIESPFRSGPGRDIRRALRLAVSPVAARRATASPESGRGVDAGVPPLVVVSYVKLEPIDVKRLDALFPRVTLWDMKKPGTERVLTPMPTSLVDRIDDYRFANRIPSRSEAIRRLIEAALEAERTRRKA